MADRHAECPCGQPRLIGYAHCPACQAVAEALYVQLPGGRLVRAVEPPTDRPMSRAQAGMGQRRGRR